MTHIGQLFEDDNNPIIHTERNIGMIGQSLEEVGAGRSIVIDENNKVVVGNGVVQAAGYVGIERVRVIETDGNEIIAIRRSNLSEEQKVKLAVYDNRTSEIKEWDPSVITGHVKAGIKFPGMWSDGEWENLQKAFKATQTDARPIDPYVNKDGTPTGYVDPIIGQLGKETGPANFVQPGGPGRIETNADDPFDKLGPPGVRSDAGSSPTTPAYDVTQNHNTQEGRLDSGLNVIGREQLPDAIFASSNEWDIPDLLLSHQALEIALPVTIWGSQARTKNMPGTFLFYCDSYRYTALFNDPSPILNTQATAAAEPNFSIMIQMPRAEALHRVFMKRYCSRYWQSMGLKILVDMNVHQDYYDLNMLGVPFGWKAYCTRGYQDNLENTNLEYEIACSQAGTKDITFCVYGGGARVKEYAKNRGHIWIPEASDVVKGKEKNFGEED